jgi:phosphatidylserine/phosphatidylglycerophosphate/cardiolipin synthase-like enzyme
VKAILDQSNETAKYSSATFLANAEIPVLIDDQHAIAHNKIMIIDGTTVLTGSFNFTKAAERSNAENLVILKGSPEFIQRYTQNFDLHAAHSHAYQHGASDSPQSRSERQAESPKQAIGTRQSTNGEAIHANRESKVYHLPSCPGYDRAGEANLVTFASESAAKRAGYHKAKNCS